MGGSTDDGRWTVVGELSPRRARVGGRCLVRASQARQDSNARAGFSAALPTPSFALVSLAPCFFPSLLFSTLDELLCISQFKLESPSLSFPCVGGYGVDDRQTLLNPSLPSTSFQPALLLLPATRRTGALTFVFLPLRSPVDAHHHL